MLWFDLGVLGLLAGIRPGGHSLGQILRTVVGRGPGRWVLACWCAPASLVFWAAVGPDVPPVAALQGERLRLLPEVNWVGEEPSGTWKAFSVHLVNKTDQQVQVYGGTSDCSCVAIGDLPVRLEAGESRSIEVRVRFGGNGGYFARRFFLWTNHRAQPVLSGIVTGRVVRPPASNARKQQLVTGG